MTQEALKLALEKIATVNAMDYEYQAWAREALAQTQEPKRTGMVYYKNDACQAKDAYSHACICWTKAQPEQEPVAWADLNALSEQINSVNCGTVYRLPSKEENRQPLYTTPPQRKPLTDEEMKKIWYAMQNIMGWYSFQEIARAIEQAHGIKEKQNGQ